MSEPTSDNHPFQSLDGDAPKLDGYRVLGVLGRGGMGVVYKAEQVKLERLVAIKAFKVSDASDENIEIHLKRFYKEARLLAKTGDHENITQIFDLPKDADGNDYLVMEFVPGMTLSERMFSIGGLGYPEAVRCAKATASALQHAHDLGVIHRDIKPQNIMLADNGKVKVMDFGIARAAAVNEETSPGMVLGTMQYISPEQLMGRDVDGRADLYSLAATLYCSLCGRPPFTDTNPFALAEQHRSVSPPPPRTFRPDIPPALEAAILKGLAKKPEERFQSAREFETALDRCLDGYSPISRELSDGSARPPSLPSSPSQSVDLFAPTAATPAVDPQSGSSFSTPAAGVLPPPLAGGLASTADVGAFSAGESAPPGFQPPFPTTPGQGVAPGFQALAPPSEPVQPPPAYEPSAAAPASSEALAPLFGKEQAPPPDPAPIPSAPSDDDGRWNEVWTPSGAIFYRLFGVLAPGLLWTGMALAVYLAPDGYAQLLEASTEAARQGAASLPGEAFQAVFAGYYELEAALPNGGGWATFGAACLAAWAYWLLAALAGRWAAAKADPRGDPNRRQCPAWLAIPLGLGGLLLCGSLLVCLAWVPGLRESAKTFLPQTPMARQIWFAVHMAMIWSCVWMLYRAAIPWSETSGASDALAKPSMAILATALLFDLLGLPAIAGGWAAVGALALHGGLLCYLRARLLGPEKAIPWGGALLLVLGATLWALRPAPATPEGEIRRDMREIAKANLLCATRGKFKEGSALPSLERLAADGYADPEAIEPPKGYPAIYKQAAAYGGPSPKDKGGWPRWGKLAAKAPAPAASSGRPAPANGTSAPSPPPAPSPAPTPAPAPKPTPVAEIDFMDD